MIFRTRLLALAVGAAAATAGCTGSDGALPPATAVEEGLRPGGSDPGLSEPARLDQLAALTSDIDFLTQVSNDRAFDCVRALGIKTPSISIAEAGLPSLDLISWPTKETIEKQRSSGYGLSTQPDGEVPPDSGGLSLDEYQQYERAMAEQPGSERETTESGLVVATTGCSAVAALEVYGSYDMFEFINSFLVGLGQEVQVGIFGSEEFIRLEAEWSSCMSSAGFAIDSHFDVTGYAYENFYPDGRFSPEGIQEELGLARSDADCLERTDYPDRGQAVSGAVVAGVYEERQSDIDGFREALANLVRLNT